jgi:hypothetical protein
MYMKRIIATLALAFLTGSAFAGEVVNKQVQKAFETEFATAREVVWSRGTDYYRAAFLYNERHVFAYFDEEGGLLGVTRYISSADLPVTLQAQLKKNYAEYWISDLFELSQPENAAYYITVENADTRLVLRSQNGSAWQVFQKTRKS